MNSVVRQLASDVAYAALPSLSSGSLLRCRRCTCRRPSRCARDRGPIISWMIYLTAPTTLLKLWLSLLWRWPTVPLSHLTCVSLPTRTPLLSTPRPRTVLRSPPSARPRGQRATNRPLHDLTRHHVDTQVRAARGWRRPRDRHELITTSTDERRRNPRAVC